MADDKLKSRQGAKAPSGGVFDVRRPGRAMAPPTSRPVIMGHRPDAQAAQTAVSGIGETSPIPARRKILIAPTGDISVGEDLPSGAPSSSPSGMPAPEAAQPQGQVKDTDGTPVPENDEDALGAAALDAVSGSPDLPAGEAPQQAEDKPKFSARPKITIKPPSESEPEEGAKEESESAVAEESKEGADTAEPSEEPAPDKSEAESEPKVAAEKPEPAAAEDTPDASPAEETVLTNDDAEKTPEDGESGEGGEEEPPKPEPHIEPLFDEHGAPIGREHHSRHSGLKAFLLVLLVLVLAAAALNILLDLEILDLEPLPHTDLL